MTSPRMARVVLLALLGCSAFLPPPQLANVGAAPWPPCVEPESPLAFPAPPAIPLEPPLQSAGPVEPPVPRVALRVRVIAASAPEQEIEYRICVHNTSLAAAHHVLVRNPLPANARFVRAVPEPSAHAPELQWLFGTLPPGICREIVLVLAPTDANDVNNCARVQFEHGQCVTTRIVRSIPVPSLPMPGAPLGKEPAPGVPPQSKEPPLGKQPSGEEPGRLVPTPKAGEAKLRLTITGPKQQYANLPARYQLTVSNPGTATATGVVVANPLPAGMTLVNASVGSRVQAEQVTWVLGNLEAGGSRTVQIVLRTRQAGEICNRATAFADGSLMDEAAFCTDFKGVSALALDVDDTVDPVPVGKETRYTIVVTNQGTAAVANVRIQAVVPPEMELLQATGASEPPPPDKLPKATAAGQALPFAPLQSLAPGAKATYEVSVRALRAGDVRFKVEMSADALEAGPVRVEESTRVFAVEEPKAPP